MKKINLLLLIVVCCILNISAQINPNATLWQKDLNYLISRIEATHPAPYSFISEKEFLNKKDSLMLKIPEMNDAEIVLAFSELLALLKDGHTAVGFIFCNPEWMNKNFHLLPVIFYPFSDGTYILGAGNNLSSIVGKKVIKIGTMKIEEVITKLKGIYSSDNDYAALKNMSYILGLAEALKKIGAVESVEKIKLTLSGNDSGEKETYIETAPFMATAGSMLRTLFPQANNNISVMNQHSERKLPLWLKNRNINYWYEFVPEDKIMYLQINSFQTNHKGGGETFEDFYNHFLNECDKTSPAKVIIDIRTNLGGQHQELPLLKGIIARPAIDKKGSLFIITGRVTFSAAQHFTTLFERYTNAVIVGEPTGGKPNHYGYVTPFRLLNNPQIAVTVSKNFIQDSEPSDYNISTYPDIYAEMSSDDYKNNIDPAFEKIKSYENIIKVGNRFQDELNNEYINKGYDAMEKLFYSQKETLKKNGYNTEKFLTQLGGKIYSNTKTPEDYISFLKLAVKEYPSSIDLNYSLAEQYDSVKKYDLAKKYFNHCLELNPACHYAKMQLKLYELENK